MDSSRKEVLRQLAVVAAGEVICLGAMLGVYAALGFFSSKVFLGGVIGAVLALLNFFAMAMVATLAADKAEAGDVKGGEKMLKSSYPLRLLALAAVLVVLAKTGIFDVLALVLPLAFVHIVIMIWGFFRKKGA